MTTPYTPLVSTEQFSMYLNNSSVIGDPRAAFMLQQAQVLCETIIYPLPLDPDGVNQVGSTGVVLDVAERAYANPTSVEGEGAGYYSEGVGPFNTTNPGQSGGGLWLTENNKETLLRLAGSGGAFMIDMLPASFTPTVPPWDDGNVWPNL